MYLIQCACSPDIDVQLLHQCFGGRPGGLRVSGFPFFATLASRLSPVLFTRSLQARLLVLLHLTTSRISRMLRILSRRVSPQ